MPIVMFLFLLALRAIASVVVLPVSSFVLFVALTLRLVGCTAVTLVLTIVLTALARPTTGRQAYPDWGEFNVMPPEIYPLSPLFMSEVLSHWLKRR